MSRQASPRATAVGLSLLGAGIIHLAAVGTHREAPTAVASFVGIGLAQMLVGGAWLSGAVPRNLRFGAAAVTIPALLFWLASRIFGLPAWTGHHAGPEAAGLGDLIAVALQVAALGLALLPIRSRNTEPRAAGHLALVVFVALLTVAGSFGTAAGDHHEAVTTVPAYGVEHGHDDSVAPHGH